MRDTFLTPQTQEIMRRQVVIMALIRSVTTFTAERSRVLQDLPQNSITRCVRRGHLKSNMILSNNKCKIYFHGEDSSVKVDQMTINQLSTGLVLQAHDVARETRCADVFFTITSGTIMITRFPIPEDVSTQTRTTLQRLEHQ